jgi:hypothetical protein
MMQVKKIRGVKRLSRAFVKGSKSAYEMKKIVKGMLYWVPSIMLGVIIAVWLLALTRHVQVCFHASESCIADVRSIQEGQ